MKESALLFVEFVGLPGAGKTTVAEELRRRLAAAGIETVSRAEIAADASGFASRQVRRGWLIVSQAPRLARQYAMMARFVAASRQSPRWGALKVFWNLCTVVALMAAHRARRGPVMIVDQGLAQAIWSVGIGASSGHAGIARWPDLLTRIGIDDVAFVLLRVSPAVARERLARRALITSRMQAADRAGQADPWRRAGEAYEVLAGGIGTLPVAGGRHGRPSTLEIDATDCDPAALAAEIHWRLFPSDTAQEPAIPCHARTS